MNNTFITYDKIKGLVDINRKILSENANLSEMEKIEIKALKKGETLMFIGDNHVLVKIEADEFEKELIE